MRQRFFYIIFRQYSFFRPDQQHHGPAHLIFHPRKIHHIFRRSRFYQIFQDKSVFQQCIYIGSQGPVVFCDLFSQKYGFPLSFVIVIIYGKMKNLPFFIIVPILRAIGSKYRMLYRENKGSAGS